MSVLIHADCTAEQAPGQDESQDVLIDVMDAEGDDMDQDNSQLVNQDVSDGEDDTIHHRHSHPTGIATTFVCRPSSWFKWTLPALTRGFWHWHFCHLTAGSSKQ